jgi:succinoglycan biosynthesis protein ExoA
LTLQQVAPAETSEAFVVIPCLNERAHITPLIATLLDDPDWLDPLVIVVDGGSTDGTCEVVRRIARANSHVRLVHNPRRIQSAGLNLAAERFGAGRRCLVRVDAHAEYPRGYVSSLVREARAVGAASVVVSMRSAGRGCFQRAAAMAQNSFLGAGGAAHRTGGPAGFVDHGHHALFDLAEFVLAGGYDASFTHNEDAELDVRLRRNGCRIWLTRAVEVVYFPRSSPLALLRQYLHYGWGRARTFRRHNEPLRLRQLAPLAVAPALLASLAAPIWPPAAAPALIWTLACCGLGAMLAVSRASLCALMSGPAAMLMHAGWSLGFWAQLIAGGNAVPPKPELVR